MNDQKKIRLAMLAFAGVLLGGGLYATITFNNQKQQEAAEQADQSSAPRNRVNLDSQIASIPQSATSASKAKPSADYAKDAKEAKDDEDDKTALTTVKPQSGAPAPQVAHAGANPVHPTKGVAAQATPNPARTTAAVVPAAPAGRPVAAAATATARPQAAPSTVAARPIVVPAKATAAPLPVPGKPIVPSVRPALAIQPPAAPAKVPPAKQNTLAHHAEAALAAAKPDSEPAESPVPAPKAGVVAATTHKEAIEAARKEAGRTNPMLRLTAFLPWPRAGKGARAGAVPSSDGPSDLPPPPDADDPSAANAPEGKPSGLNNIQGHIADKLIPPPPPNAQAGGGLDDLNLDQLPVPPSKPIIGDQMKVLSVVDDKAIVSFPRELSKKNNWPAFITLGTGEQFDSIKIISVSPDGVTIEEDGERSLRPLPTIK